MDLFALLAGLLATVSLIRAWPLIQDLRRHNVNANVWDDLKLGYNWKYRQDAFRHLLFVFVDIIFVPMFVLCLLSGYRGIEIVHMMIDTDRWNETRMNRIRKKIFFNFLWLLIDLICFAWMFVIVVVTLYRLPGVYTCF